MRPQQWIKNLFLFAALIFSGNLFVLRDVLLTIAGFLFFCLASSGVYLFNDVSDLENDKLHPVKSQRPLPSGKLSVASALTSSALLAGAGLLGGFYLRTEFGFLMLLYLAINVLYSLKLKDVVIIDVMTI